MEKDPDGLAAVNPGPILDLGNGGGRKPFPNSEPHYSASRALIQHLSSDTGFTSRRAPGFQHLKIDAESPSGASSSQARANRAASRILADASSDRKGAALRVMASGVIISLEFRLLVYPIKGIRIYQIRIYHRQADMTYLIKDETVVQQLKALAQRKNKTVADVLRQVVVQEIEREESRASTFEKIGPVLAKARAIGKPVGRIDWDAEKNASDELWGE